MSGQEQYASPDFSTYQSYPDWLKELYDTSPPRWAPFPSGRPNLLDLYEFASIELSGGRQPLRSWQKFSALVETEMEFDDDVGLWLPVYDQTLTTVPRQLGKSWYEIVGLIIDLMTMNPTDQSMFLAQSGKDAKAMIFDKWLPKIELSSLWEFLQIKTNKGNSPNIWSEMARTRVVIHSGSEESGHGGTLRRVRGDEIWALLEAMIEHSTGAATRAVADAQERYVSTVGQEDSDLMNGLIYRGRDDLAAGVNSGLALIEWSGDEERDPGDPEVWQQATPCLNEVSAGGEGVTSKSIAKEYDKDKTPSKVYFRRKALNQIGKATIDTAVNLHLYDMSCVSHEEFNRPEPFPTGRTAVGIDTILDGTMASIAIVDETWRVALTDHERGRAWVVGRLAEAYEDPASPTFKVVGAQMGTMLEPNYEQIEQRLRWVGVRKFNHAERAAACANMRDRIHGVDEDDNEVEGLRILANPWLRKAVVEAAKPKEESRMLYCFERAKPTSILSPLYAATYAVAVMTEMLAKPRTGGTFIQ